MCRAWGLMGLMGLNDLDLNALGVRRQYISDLLRM